MNWEKFLKLCYDDIKFILKYMYLRHMIRFEPLKRYIRNDEFDFPDKTMGQMISNCFKIIGRISKKRLLICSKQLYPLVLRGEIFACPDLILSLVIDFMTKPADCLQVSISSMQSFLQKDLLFEMKCAPQVSET